LFEEELRPPMAEHGEDEEKGGIAEREPRHAGDRQGQMDEARERDRIEGADREHDAEERQQAERQPGPFGPATQRSRGGEQAAERRAAAMAFGGTERLGLGDGSGLGLAAGTLNDAAIAAPAPADRPVPPDEQGTAQRRKGEHQKQRERQQEFRESRMDQAGRHSIAPSSASPSP